MVGFKEGRVEKEGCPLLKQLNVSLNLSWRYHDINLINPSRPFSCLDSRQIQDIYMYRSKTDLGHLYIQVHNRSRTSIYRSQTDLGHLYISPRQIQDIYIQVLDRFRLPIQVLDRLGHLYISPRQIQDIYIQVHNRSRTSICIGPRQIQDIYIYRSITDLGHLYIGPRQIQDIYIQVLDRSRTSIYQFQTDLGHLYIGP